MTYDQWLKFATDKLTQTGIKSARLDALLILEQALDLSRSYILAHPDDILQSKNIIKLDILLTRRLNSEPMAYILGKKQFYGREFSITPDVLIPRPDSETIIELLLDYTNCSRVGPCSIIDIGTGSGCLAITAKLELPEAQITACDISNKVLAVAKNNAKKLNANIKFIQSDLLGNINEKFDIVLANLPYVPDDYNVSPDVKHEPNAALYAGSDGLDIINEFFKQLPKNINQSGLAIMESLLTQHKKIEQLAKTSGFRLVETKELIQVYKYL